MSQQINLFNPLFRPKGFSFTSAMAMLYGAGITVAVLAAVIVYEDYGLRTAQNIAQSVDAEYKATAAKRDKLVAEAAQQKPDAQLLNELTDLEALLTSRQDIVETLKGGAIGNTQGFSDYMLAFSRQNMSGLWLTGFDIALSGNELAIQGRTLNAETVAQYLARLNQEKALSGRQFGVMKINRQTELVVDPAKKGDPPAPKGPTYLEFSLSTTDLPVLMKPVPTTKTETVPVPLMGVMKSNPAPEPAKAVAAGAQK